MHFNAIPCAEQDQRLRSIPVDDPMQSLLETLRVLAKDPAKNRDLARVRIDEFLRPLGDTSRRDSLRAALRFEALTRPPEETGFWTGIAGHL